MTATKWRVERAGAPRGGGYIAGWLALSTTGTGAWFPTHEEAINFATEQADATAAKMTRAEAAAAAVGALRLASAATKTQDGVACRIGIHEVCGTHWCACTCHVAGGTR